jgi:hypothetical protein
MDGRTSVRVTDSYGSYGLFKIKMFPLETVELLRTRKPKKGYVWEEENSKDEQPEQKKQKKR